MCVKHGKYHCSCTKHRFFVGGAPLYIYIYIQFLPLVLRSVPGRSEQVGILQSDLFVSWANFRGVEVDLAGSKHRRT